MEILSPFILSRIIDAPEETEVNLTGINYFQVITSDKGRANKLVRHTSEINYVNEFGTPNFKKHGLAPYNAANFLANGVATYILRVVPFLDAEKPMYLPGSIANTFLDVQTKRVPAKEEESIDSFSSIVLTEMASKIKVQANHANSLSLEPGMEVTRYKEIGSALNEKITPYIYLSGNFNTTGLEAGDTLNFYSLTDITTPIVSGIAIVPSATAPIVSGKSLVVEDNATLRLHDGEELIIKKGSDLLGTVSVQSVSLVKAATGETPYEGIYFSTYIEYSTNYYQILPIKTIDTSFFINRKGDEVLTPVINAIYSSLILDETIVKTGTGPYSYEFFISKTEGFYTEGEYETYESLTVIIPEKNAYTLCRPILVSKYATSYAELDAFIANPYSSTNPYFTETTTDGFKRHILLGLTGNHTKDDNNLGIKFSSYNVEDEDDLGYRLYNFEVFIKINNVEKTIFGPEVVSLDPTALDKYGRSYYIADVLKNVVSFSDRLTFVDNPDVFNSLVTDLTIDGVDINPTLFDFLLKQERDSSSRTDLEQKYIEVDASAVDASIQPIGVLNYNYKQSNFAVITSSIVNDVLYKFYATYGNFNQGSSGSLDGFFADGTLLSNSDMTALKNYLKAAAYRGYITTEVIDRRNFPFDVVMDSCESFDVKKAIIDLAGNEERKDFFVFLDLAIDPNYLSALNSRNNLLAEVNTFYSAIYGQSAIYTDKYNNAEIKAPLLYELSTKIPKIDSTIGVHEIIAGYGYGEINTIKTGSLSYTPNKAQADELYKARINYAITDRNNTRLMTQLTSQTKNTPLTNIFAIRTLLRMKREGEEIAERYQNKRVKFINNNLKKDLDEQFAQYVSNEACDYITVTVYQNANEVRKKIMRIKVDVKFADIVESFIFDFVVQTA